jgi:hypothetical protein
MVDENLIEIPASEILDKIKNGESMVYDKVLIKGDLDISKLGLPKDEKGRFIIDSKIIIEHSKFSGVTFFSGSQFDNVVIFNGSQFNSTAFFSESQFNHAIVFIESQFNSDAFFIGSQFSGGTSFSGSQFRGKAYFYGCQFSDEEVSFEGAIFKDPYSEEDACRRAKNVSEKAGNRAEAGNYFYREMDAKRRQKPWYIRYPEFIFIQTVFGYGVHPFRLWSCWFLFVGIFALVYWRFGGIDANLSQLPGNATLVDNIWFSIATAVTPGYAGYKPTSAFKLVAGLEAIFGTFMWAAFIATFARKYMR